MLQDSRAARLVRQELDLPAVVIAHYGRLDELLSRSDVKLALYVNHNPQNFAALRFTSLAHVYLTHGDSDKGVSVSNQSKAYDFIFVPGQAAVDRIQAYTMFYDAAPHCVLIGCPQLDVDRPAGRSTPAADRRRCSTHRPGRVRNRPWPTGPSPRTGRRWCGRCSRTGASPSPTGPTRSAGSPVLSTATRTPRSVVW